MGFSHPDYTIIKELGHGASGVVYLAVQNQLNRRVAVKVFNNQLSHHGADSRFQREARILAQLEHPHIVPVYELSPLPDEHGYLMTMAYVDGGTLRQRSADLTLRQALAVITQMADALGYAHESGFVHRDVKPDNILFQNNQALLADFGIAREAESETQLTQHGTMLGTPEYMSPEQVNGEAVDARSDLYSLGIVFYELLNGRPPFQTESAIATGIQHLTAAVAPLPAVFAAYQALMDRLLAKTKEHRPASARELVSELKQSTASYRWSLDEPLDVLRSKSPRQSAETVSTVQVKRASGSIARALTVLVAASVVLAWIFQRASDDSQGSQAPPVISQKTPAQRSASEDAITPATIQDANTEDGSTVQAPVQSSENPVSRNSQPSSDSTQQNSNRLELNPEVTGSFSTSDSRVNENSDTLAQNTLSDKLDMANSLWLSGTWFEGESNAVTAFREILALDPGRQDAVAALEDILTKTLTDAEQSISDRRPDRASNHLQHLREYWPADYRVTLLEEKIQSARARELEAELVRQKALEQKKIQQEKIIRLQALLQSAQAAERAGNLFEPENESAYFYYQKILQEDARNSNATSAINGLKDMLLQRVNDVTMAGQVADTGQFDVAEQQLFTLNLYYPNDRSIALARDRLDASKRELEGRLAETRRLEEEARKLDVSIASLRDEINQWMSQPTATAQAGYGNIDNRIDQLQLRSPQNATLNGLRATVLQHLQTLNSKKEAESAREIEDSFNMPGF